MNWDKSRCSEKRWPKHLLLRAEHLLLYPNTCCQELRKQKLVKRCGEPINIILHRSINIKGIFVEDMRSSTHLEFPNPKKRLLKTYLPFNQFVVYNVSSFQHKSSKSCGQFCLFYIYHKYFNLDVNLFDILCDIFSKHPEKNEKKG